jgi:hypothetical protein
MSFLHHPEPLRFLWPSFNGNERQIDARGHHVVTKSAALNKKVH